MYGEPALPPDFVSLPYATPDAPKGGRIIQGEGGSFDSLNPHIRKGSVPWQLRFLAYESLMGRSWDEPFTLYGLLAESIETPEDRSWVEFTLREEARFSDGSPVTVEDVMWSYETLGTVGHPRYADFGPRSRRWSRRGPAPSGSPSTWRIGPCADHRHAPDLEEGPVGGARFTESGLEPPIAIYVIAITSLAVLYRCSATRLLGQRSELPTRDQQPR